MQPVKVLFVCLGNICRSPMAEGLFLHHVSQAGLGHAFEVDSAGTSGHHEGELADRRMRQTATGHGIALTTHSRPLRRQDFTDFHYILTMDRSVHRDVLRVQATTQGAAKVELMRDYDAESDVADVPDPYYGGMDGFEEVYRILDRSTRRLLASLRAAQGL